MAYQQNIPQPTDQLSVSQGDLLGNFQSLFAWANVNHVTFDVADAGKHKWVTFPRQGVTPTPPFGATELSLYNLLNATTGASELYVQKGVGTGVPFTASSQNPNGWSYLPSGILIKWGFGNGSGASSVNLAAIGPAFSGAPFVAFANANNSAASDTNQYARVMSVSMNTLQVWCSQRTTTSNAAVTYSWLVIGN